MPRVPTAAEALRCGVPDEVACSSAAERSCVNNDNALLGGFATRSAGVAVTSARHRVRRQHPTSASENRQAKPRLTGRAGAAEDGAAAEVVGR